MMNFAGNIFSPARVLPGDERGASERAMIFY